MEKHSYLYKISQKRITWESYAIYAYTFYLLGVLSMGICSWFLFIIGCLSIKYFYTVYLPIFMINCLLGNWLIKCFCQPIKTITIPSLNEQELLQLFRLNKKQVKAYIELSRSECNSSEQTEELLNLMDECSQHNIIQVVSAYIRQKEIDSSAIAQVFPDFTASEREICLLILQGKKLNEICKILKKTETNICSQRAHIRKKLRLETQDNLQNALQEKIRNKQIKLLRQADGKFETGG